MKNQVSSNIINILQQIEPVMLESTFLFVSVIDFYKKGKWSEKEKILKSAKMMFREKEGVTLIIDQNNRAELSLEQYEASEVAFKCISLRLNTDLELVGLTSAISSELASHDISCNIVAGFYHDHIFVPISQAEKALTVLQQFKENAI